VGGTALELAGIRFEVRHVPGHAPGHVILYVPAAGVAFVGDVVFQGSIGRSDLPGGDFQQLMRSIREQVLTLPDETALYPGHGPSTTVGHERISNPFLVPNLRGGFA
jgi:glyoxylase-like metal-dependent hydrolase (beta-lactamase superfamily II)